MSRAALALIPCSLLFNSILSEMGVVGGGKTKKVRRAEKITDGRGRTWGQCGLNDSSFDLTKSCGCSKAVPDAGVRDTWSRISFT